MLDFVRKKNRYIFKSNPCGFGEFNEIQLQPIHKTIKVYAFCNGRMFERMLLTNKPAQLCVAKTPTEKRKNNNEN